MRTTPATASTAASTVTRVILAMLAAVVLSGCAATSGYSNAPVLGGVAPGASVQSEIARGR